MFTFALLRDSSDLHIYKDLYEKNNDCLCNLRSIYGESKPISLKLAEWL